jgi:hypothetical protein
MAEWQLDIYLVSVCSSSSDPPKNGLLPKVKFSFNFCGHKTYNLTRLTCEKSCKVGSYINTEFEPKH